MSCENKTEEERDDIQENCLANPKKRFIAETCECECAPDACVGQTGKIPVGDDCDCVCDSSITCYDPDGPDRNNKKYMETSNGSCGCICDPADRDRCIHDLSEDDHAYAASRGLYWAYSENTCTCYLRSTEEHTTVCPKLDTQYDLVSSGGLYYDMISGCTPDTNQNFYLNTCECECIPDICPDNMIQNEGSCACECDPIDKRFCELIYGEVNESNEGCKCENYNIFLTEQALKDKREMAINDIHPFQEADSVIVGYQTNNQETRSIKYVSTTNRTSSINKSNVNIQVAQNGFIELGEALENNHEVGVAVVPIKNEESTTHTISDPHIKTFFDKKYEI